MPLLMLGFGAFAIGCFVSLRRLDVSLVELRSGALAVTALLVVPSLIYGGIGLSLLARSAGTSMPLGRATLVSTYANLAELLPVPGGAIVRTGALVRAGGTVPKSTAVVLATAVLSVSLAMLGAGLTLLPSSVYLAWPVIAAGMAVSLAIGIWLWRSSDGVVALQTSVHRIAGILLTAVRLHFAFAAFGTSIGLLNAMPFVLALLLGSASSIAPAGLGLSEALAALAATTVSCSPEVAFLAVGLDRLLCLVGYALFAIGAQLVQHAVTRSGRAYHFSIAKEN